MRRNVEDVTPITRYLSGDAPNSTLITGLEVLYYISINRNFPFHKQISIDYRYTLFLDLGVH